MELKLHVGYEQILQLVRQLPFREKQQLTYELEKELQDEEPLTKGGSPESSDLYTFLLSGPTMSDEQFNAFQELRKNFQRWIER
jgi:hypothetical protein